MKKLSLLILAFCLHTGFLSASDESSLNRTNNTALVLSPKSAAGAAAALVTLATAHLPSDMAFFAAGMAAPSVVKRVTGCSAAENIAHAFRILVARATNSEMLSNTPHADVPAAGDNALVTALSMASNPSAALQQLKKAALPPEGKKAATYGLAGSAGVGAVWYLVGNQIKRYGGAAVVGLGTFYWVRDLLENGTISTEDTTPGAE